MARVVIEQLTKVFRGAAGLEFRPLREVSLTLQDGELLVLVGPSGSGKSTLLRLIAGLEEVTQGTITIGDRVVNDVEPRHRDVAMVFQNFALYPHMTARENLTFPLKLRKFSPAEIERRVAEAANLLGLGACLDRRPAALSGGERQRVAMGRALVRQPQVLLLDEPLSNLDAPLRAALRAEIARLHRQLRNTMLYVTHDQAEAMTLGDRIAVLKDGAIQQVAGPLTLYHQPVNRFVAGFIGAPPMNFFTGTIAPEGDGLKFCAEGKDDASFRLAVSKDHASRLAAYAGRRVILGLRPEHLSLRDSAAGESTVAACAELLEPLGPESLLQARAGPHSFVARVPAATKASPGQPLQVAFDMNNAHFFDAATGQAIHGDARHE